VEEKEWDPKSVSTPRFSPTFQSWMLGVVRLSVCACGAGSEQHWPLLIVVEVGPALVSLLILPLLPETPRYLLLVTQNRDSARKGLHSDRITLLYCGKCTSEAAPLCLEVKAEYYQNCSVLCCVRQLYTTVCTQM